VAALTSEGLVVGPTDEDVGTSGRRGTPGDGRSAVGEQEDDVEVVEVEREAAERDGDQRAAKQRPRDSPEALPRVGAVDAGGLVDLVGDRRERAERGGHQE